MKKVFTDSDVGRVVANDIVLVPDSSWQTLKLTACHKHCQWVQKSTLDVLGQVIVWKVVAIRHDVVIGTRIRQEAAELSNCNKTFTHHQPYTIHKV